MDQLCINQDDSEEKAQEVQKMRQYYNNSSATLVSINAKVPSELLNYLPDILKMIVRSKWFNSSWSYQEG